MTKVTNKLTVAVIGGGPAGMLCAGELGRRGCEVSLFERNPIPGKKLRITGKGRCNLTNDCTREEFFDNIPTNPKFLYSAYAGFDSRGVMDFFESLGVMLKTERGNRVFPVSDRAGQVADALASFCRQNGVRFIHRRVLSVKKQPTGFLIEAAQEQLSCDRVVIATGGVSYRATGSDGDGYAFAASLGHDIIPPAPSLVPLLCAEECCAEMMGLSLKNVSVTFTQTDGRVAYRDFGELLFTHFGVSGPVILSASARLRPVIPGKYRLTIDCKPALGEAELDRRILSDFSKNLNRNFSNSLSALLPQKLIAPVIRLSGIDGYKKVNEITRDDRHRLLSVIKAFPLTVTGTRDINEAIITSGGVDTRQINPKTMESKLCPGLYFAGEVIDCDGYTGGFNLQIAFSTAYAAAAGITGEKQHGL